ncbi:MAG TPA: transporter substrate-binding domain-containing protein [Solirubrobacteraceae bacterium]|nr:transporter substrate-binding domain-containing protein [Solirubrobacteraceae bacterium]
MRWTHLPGAALAALVLLVAGCGSDEGAPAGGGAGLDTIEEGKLKVAVQSYAPYTALRGDRIEGLDGDILHAVADRLGLEVQPQLTDFNGMLGGVQSRRVDITVGGVAWSEERQKEGLFTDPPYYSPPAMGVQSGESYSTVDDLQGLRLGTVTGYVWVDSIKAIPDAELGAYPNANGVFDDLGSGRLDAGFLDPLLIINQQKARPDQKIETQYLEPPTEAQVAEHPEYEFFRPYMTAFYLPKQAPKLEAAISEEIRAMYESGELAKLIDKYGGDPAQFLKASPWMGEMRQGVDRPADWAPPSL